MRVGVLALQGDFAEHITICRTIGVETVEVRSDVQAEQADALIIPGGESTTILKLIDRFELRELLIKRIKEGMPVFGTCAGAIVLATKVSDGEPPFGLLDISIERNAYGRQVESFEAEIDVPRIGSVVRGAFIRAPIITGVADEVETIATHEGAPVLVRSGAMVAATFHPEIVGETRVHRWFFSEVC